MSTLGIKNVLPYTGANGIVVNNNIISIDPEGDIFTKNLQAKDTISLINETNNFLIWRVTQDNEMELRNGGGQTVFFVNSDVLQLLKNNNNFLLIDNQSETLEIFNSVNGNAILAGDSLQFDTIGLNNTNGFISISENLSSVSGEIVGAVTPSLIKHLVFNIGNINYKIIIAQ